VTDRYEPLPSLGELPGWLWRRAGTGVRLTAGATLLVAVAAAVVLVPAISQSHRERAVEQRRAAGAARAATTRRLKAEQRPHFGISGHAASPAMLRDTAAAIFADARRRVTAGTLQGPILRVTCEPFPRTLGGAPPERDPSKRRGRYQCIAVTADIHGTRRNEAGALGHPYRALVHFTTGRYAYCKVSGRPDPVKDPAVTTPRACGG
jgi:hypothetical protein